MEYVLSSSDSSGVPDVAASVPFVFLKKALASVVTQCKQGNVGDESEGKRKFHVRRN